MVVIKLFRRLFGVLGEINNSHQQSLDRVDRLCLAEYLGAQQGKAALAHYHIDRLSVALDSAAAKSAEILDEDGLCQKSSFADGTTVTVDFTQNTYEIIAD